MDSLNTIDTTQYKELDNSIINNTPLKTNSTPRTVETVYSNLTWYKKYKQQSAVLNRVLKHSVELAHFGFTEDDAIKGICSLVNYTNRKIFNKKHTYFRVPERYICQRVECSRDRLLMLINIYYKMGIIDMKRTGITTSIKVDMKLMEQDKYITAKCKSFYKTDCISLERIINQHQSLYYYNYSGPVQKIKETEFYMGVTIAYNMLMEDNKGYFISFREDKNNSDNNILYGEFPIHLLCRHFNCNEAKCFKKLVDLCFHTDYIKKHDLVYSDVKYTGKQHQKQHIKNPDHYLNCNYKTFAKNAYYKMNDIYGNSYEENHPRVTPCSVIIFTEKFKKTNAGKRVLRNIQMYKDIVYYLVKDNITDPKLYKTCAYLNEHCDVQQYEECFDKIYDNNEDEQDNAYERQSVQEFGKNLVFGSIDDEGNKIQASGRIVTINQLKKTKVNRETYRKRLKLFSEKYIEKRSIESLIKFYALVCYEVGRCMTKDFKYYISLLNKLVEYISDKLYTAFRKLSNRCIRFKKSYKTM